MHTGEHLINLQWRYCNAHGVLVHLLTKYTGTSIGDRHVDEQISCFLLVFHYYIWYIRVTLLVSLNRQVLEYSRYFVFRVTCS